MKITLYGELTTLRQNEVWSSTGIGTRPATVQLIEGAEIKSVEAAVVNL